MANKNLNKAKEAKKDEFYTQLEDIKKKQILLLPTLHFPYSENM